MGPLSGLWREFSAVFFLRTELMACLSGLEPAVFLDCKAFEGGSRSTVLTNCTSPSSLDSSTVRSMAPDIMAGMARRAGVGAV